MITYYFWIEKQMNNIMGKYSCFDSQIENDWHDN